VLLPVALAACEPRLGAGVIEIRAAHRLDVPPARPDTPPGAAAFAAAPLVPLTDRWTIAQRTAASGAWYGAQVDLQEAPRERWAVYLPRAMMNAAVWINGESAGVAGRLRPQPTRNWNQPLLFPLPPGTLHAGTNELRIELAIQATYQALLAPVFVGPEAALRPAYEWQSFWQVTAVQVSIVLAAYWGFVGLALTTLRRDVPAFGWSAGGCLLWAVAMLELIVHEPPLAAGVWQWLTASALGASLACFAVAARRFLGLGARLRVVVPLWASGSLAIGAALAHGSPWLVQLVIVSNAVAVALAGLYLIRLLFVIRGRVLRSQGRSLPLSAPLALVGLVFALHDGARIAGLEVPPALILLPYGGAILGLWGGARLVEDLAHALADSEALNRDLERRVEERGAEIERRAEQIRRLEREHLLQRERERMMRDIHDGMGAQLTTTLALVESGQVAHDDVADALRDALDDMRLLVASLGPTADDLLALLATWRARIERRLERRGLRFDWQVDDLPPLPWLGPRQALSVLRIVQEALTNVVKHAGAHTITVRTGVRAGAAGAPGVVIEISDDGRGMPATGTQGDARAGRDGRAMPSASFGMGNMARRAADLGGSVEVGSASPGTRVVVWLPLESRVAREEGQ
jgi:signal transduction histidine kinase